MSALQSILIVLAVYLLVVVVFEVVVMTIGKRQADRGLSANEIWIAITTTEAGESRDVVVAGVAVEGGLYASANHWPRSWFNRVVANPEVEVTRRGERSAYHAVLVEGEERNRVAKIYRVPFIVRILTGFPPRAFVRFDPK